MEVVYKEAIPPMRLSHRIMFCLLSNLVAVAVAALFGAGLPAAKLLHEWYPGVLVSFLAILTVLMSVTLRRGRETSLWTIPTSAALSYPAAALAYISYFALFEPERWGNDKLILSACGRPCHPDDASMKIIEALWQALQD